MGDNILYQPVLVDSATGIWVCELLGYHFDFPFINHPMEVNRNDEIVSLPHRSTFYDTL